MDGSKVGWEGRAEVGYDAHSRDPRTRAPGAAPGRTPRSCSLRVEPIEADSAYGPGDLPLSWDMRRVLPFLAGAVLVVIVVIGLTQAGGESSPQKAAQRFDLSTAQQRLAGAPPALSGLHAQANQLLGGGKTAFASRLSELKGHPVVVNKWASWCVSCQSEFPVFESVGTKEGKPVAFLGVNGTDVDGKAKAFLAKRPLPFPSYADPQEEIARAIEAPKNYPMTVFYDPKGKRAYIHSGPYRSDADLIADIDRYAR